MPACFRSRLVGFLPADDPRVVGTVKAVEKWLVRDGLVLRYRTEQTDDGLPPGEGAFLACSFWLADVLVLQGRYADARQLFDRLSNLCNDVGLLAEEYDPVAGRMLGIAQAFQPCRADQYRAQPARATGPAEERAEGADDIPAPELA